MIFIIKIKSQKKLCNTLSIYKSRQLCSGCYFKYPSNTIHQIYARFWVQCGSGMFYEEHGVPECMDTVDTAWHVLPVVDICGLRIENLRRGRGDRRT